MPRTPDWRLSSTADALNQLDRAGLAWEFLRRNPGYRKDYRRIDHDAADADGTATAAGERWGLCFRLQPRSPGWACSGNLAAGATAHKRCPGRGTG